MSQLPDPNHVEHVTPTSFLILMIFCEIRESNEDDFVLCLISDEIPEQSRLLGLLKSNTGTVFSFLQKISALKNLSPRVVNMYYNN
jgi:hypothetical protein